MKMYTMFLEVRKYSVLLETAEKWETSKKKVKMVRQKF